MLAPLRLTEIDVAKGLAIVLVVYGHIVARTPPQQNDWYVISRELVYLFHTPFFMFLSGVVAGYRRLEIGDFTQYFAYVAGKFRRLFPAYLLFGMAVVATKAVAGRYVHVDNPPPSLGAGMVDLLLFPTLSSASFLWFVYVLFLQYATLPLVLAVFGRKLGWAVALGVALYFAEGPDFLAIADFARFFVFFIAGVWAGRNYAAVADILDRYRASFLLLFLSALAIALPIGLPRLVVGMLSIPALLGLSRGPVVSRNRLLSSLGRLSFPIYLMNTLAIGTVKAMGLKIVPWDGCNFLIYAPVLLLSGLALPILAKRVVIERFPVLDRITN